jgi:hypothetical protein
MTVERRQRISDPLAATERRYDLEELAGRLIAFLHPSSAG